ncbi:MAG: hypothetical protein IKT12_04760, partial [Thermoguttaceae bacterium]|nr:hypothetical protein [Thermoguttaceae bacterium]
LNDSNTIPAPSGDSFAAQAGTASDGSAAPSPMVSDEELLGEPSDGTAFGAPAAPEGEAEKSALPEGNVPAESSANADGTTLSAAVSAGSAGGEPSLFAQGDAPYTAPAAAPTTPFAELSAETSGEKGGGASIDPRQTVGNTTFLSGNQGEAAPSADGVDAAAGSGGRPADAKDAPKEPRVKAERDKREINLAEELKKPTQTSIERPITVICKEDAVVFPTQAGVRGVREIPLRNDGDRQGILKEVVAIVHGWHAAGRNMYWSPWIRIQTAPGGEETAARLETLMRSQRVRVERLDREAP